MFSLRDWPTYVWVPLILLVLVGGPYSYWASYRQAQRNESVLMALSQGKQIEVQISSAASSLQADAKFMSELPPIQGIIDARKRPEADSNEETVGGSDGESEQVWRERLEAIFQGMLAANPAYLSATYMQLDEFGGREIARVERHKKGSDLIHAVPENCLSLVAAHESLTGARELLPGEANIFCTELIRTDQVHERFTGKRLIAVVAAHDHGNGELFGVVIRELDLKSVVDTLLTPTLLTPGEGQSDVVYITDQEGAVLLSSEANTVGKSPAAESNIAAIVPQTAGFLAPENQASMLTDQRSFVALKIWLDPDSVIAVVIRFAT